MGDLKKNHAVLDNEKDLFLALYKKKLLELQKELLEFPQVECQTMHDFSPGLYIRTIFIPKGTFLMGKTHKTEHFNIALAGKAFVMIDGEIQYIEAPFMFKSLAGKKKVFNVVEDLVWSTTHVTKETDLDILEKQIVFSDDEELDQMKLEFKRLI